MSAPILVIVNPKAREGGLGERWTQLEGELLETLGTGARVVFSSAEDHGSGIARRALKEGVSRLVVVGGDGTLSEVIQGFFENGAAVNPEASLAVMPAGRGNDFLKTMIGHRTFSAEEAWRQALALVKNGKPQPIDVGRYDWVGASAAHRYFVNIASFGFPGLVVKRVMNRSGLLGAWVGKSALTYAYQIANAMLEYKPLRMEVKVDGQLFYEGFVFSGFVLNGKYNAGGMCWSREARLDDALFNIVVSEPRSPLATALTGGKMISGDWRGVPGVHVTAGRKIEVREVDGQRRAHPLFEIDGDLPEPPDAHGAVLELIPGAIRLWR